MAGCENETVVLFDTENSIILGDYLDILLNRRLPPENSGEQLPQGQYVRHLHDKQSSSAVSKLSQYEHIYYAKRSARLTGNPEGTPFFVYSGGIKLPQYCGQEKTDEGSGNIVIAGKPGAGKSTMAFQFAAACASDVNRGIGVYFSLDVEEKQIVKSMRRPDGALRVNYLCSFPCTKPEEPPGFEAGSDEELEARFREALQKEGGRVAPQLVMPKLSPRGISPDLDIGEDAIFLQRIDELQMLLRAISTYNRRERRKQPSDREPMVKLVVIDSLDVFGEATLTREEINRLFMLFKQFGIIGVFTMGAVGSNPLDAEALCQAAVSYQADVVIELKKKFFNNYTCSTFEIVKSRSVQHVLGHHPYKVENCKPPASKREPGEFSLTNMALIKKVVVLPSLHYRISASENSLPVEPPQGEQRDQNIFGIPQMTDILPNHFRGRRMDYPQIITIWGGSGLFKSDIALNALLSGIFYEGEKGLIVRLGDRDAFAVRGLRFEKGLLAEAKKRCGQADSSNPVIIPFYEKGEEYIHNEEPNKYTLRGWSPGEADGDAMLLEVTFKNGALLPEEFVDEICRIINLYQIRRVAFIDLKYIGSSYPFLVNSDTSGNLFLSAFVHIMRNYGRHVIMSSSESGLELSNIELNKAGILADAILNCSATLENGLYGDVTITGEGLITNKGRKRARIVIDYDEAYILNFHSSKLTSDIRLYPFHIDLENSSENAP